MVQVGQFYKGSGLLQPLCKETGIPIDQMNFLACNLVAFVCGVLMRKTLPPCKKNTTMRHCMEVSLGLVLACFCFGYQAVHLLLYSTLPYLLMLYGPRNHYHTLVFIVAMAYISIMHAYRMYYDYGGFSVDVTGALPTCLSLDISVQDTAYVITWSSLTITEPLMILTQKVTSVAYALHDGTAVPDERLSEDQKKQCIRQAPTVLCYYSYILSFHNIMAGPLVFYSDYIKFIAGDNLKIPPCEQMNIEKRKLCQPCPNRAIAETFVIAVGCGILMKLTPVYFPFTRMAEDDFLYNTTIVYRNIYVLIAISLQRCKYYFAWKLGELTNLGAGLGFNGYDKDGNDKWDLLTNVKIWQLETSSSLKVFIDSWNVNTLIWFRRVIYDRTPSSVNTLAVFVCSAIWHGLYPGYYVTFISTVVAVTAARLVRRNIRPYFLDSKQTKFFYNCVTFIGTRVAGTYLLGPFVLLEFVAGIKLLISVGLHLHILSAAAIIYYTIVKPPRTMKKLE